MVTGFEVHVDAAALADMERAEEAARTHVAAVRSARASAGGMTGAGGRATMSGLHAPRISSLGGMTGAGGKAGLGKKRGIYKKQHQTAAQAAHAEYMRKYRVA